MASRSSKRQPKPTTAIVADTNTTTAPAAPVETATTVPAHRPALSLTTAPGAVDAITPGYVAPVWLGAFIAGFRAVTGMPSVTVDERRAVMAAFDAAVSAIMPNVAPPVGRHTGRYTGMPVFESQNVLYVAAALSNVVVTGGAIMAAWRVELPNAKCDYLAKNYAWTTLSEYTRGAHNGAPNVPNANAIVTAWSARNRTPVDVNA